MINFQNTRNTIVNSMLDIKFLFKIVAVFLCFTATLFSSNYETFTLRNGLEIHIIKTNSPIVTHVIAYNIGSRQETSSKEGIAHYLEHTMFLGTNKYSKKDFSNIIKETGAYYNAFTSYDLTVYYFNLPARHIEKAIKLEADRMKWLLFNEKDVENEKQVVNQENNMYKNNVYSTFYDSLRKNMFPTTNYGRTIIGWEDDFNKLTKKDLQEFYNKWYTPNNAKLFIIGNVNVKEVKKLVSSYYGRVKSPRKKPERTKSIEEQYNSNVTVNFKDPRINQEVIVKSYLVPSLNSDTSEEKRDAYSLMVLENLLSSNFGKIYKYLVLEKKVLSDFDVSYSKDNQGSAIFSFSLIPSNNKKTEDVLKEFDFILNKTMEEGFSSADLKLSVNLVKDNLELLRENDMDYLIMIVRYMNAGLTYEDTQNLISNISKVKILDVKQAYKKYIKDSNYVIGVAKNK